MNRRGTRMGVGGLLLSFLLLVSPGRAADYSYAQIKGTAATGGASYGAVTLVSPFGKTPDAAIPLFLLAGKGDYANPWVRARRVAEILPKVTELVLFKGESIHVSTDVDGAPALFVGPRGSRPGSHLRILSVLPEDVGRFQAEENAADTGRTVDPKLVARYWQTLLVDYITLFIRYPLTREKDILKYLNLIETKAGLIFKRLLIEVAVLLRYDNIPEDEVDADLLRAKFGEAIRSMSPTQWGQLTALAFRIPLEFGKNNSD